MTLVLVLEEIVKTSHLLVEVINQLVTALFVVNEIANLILEIILSAILCSLDLQLAFKLNFTLMHILRLVLLVIRGRSFNISETTTHRFCQNVRVIFKVL